jgi:hypothetical protein
MMTAGWAQKRLPRHRLIDVPLAVAVAVVALALI